MTKLYTIVKSEHSPNWVNYEFIGIVGTYEQCWNRAAYIPSGKSIFFDIVEFETTTDCSDWHGISYEMKNILDINTSNYD